MSLFPCSLAFHFSPSFSQSNLYYSVCNIPFLENVSSRCNNLYYINIHVIIFILNILTLNKITIKDIIIYNTVPIILATMTSASLLVIILYELISKQNEQGQLMQAELPEHQREGEHIGTSISHFNTVLLPHLSFLYNILPEGRTSQG